MPGAPAEYLITNAFGAGPVTAEEARRVYEGWPAERRSGDLEAGFVVWDVSEPSGTMLMATRYTPLEDT